MTDTYYYDMDSRNLALELIGKSIVAIGEGAMEGTMTLNDGTVLEFEDTYDCCAHFHANLEEIDLTDNAITSVKHVDTSNGEYDEKWSLHILSKHKLIAKVNIEGDSGSGYYCHSINLMVKRPEGSA